MPLISIIIPTFNRADFLSETILSIQNQTIDNWECIVIDDGSTDNTEAIMNQFICTDNRFIFVKRDIEPKGSNTCRNIGITRSTGKYICFFDSDDIMMPDFLEKRYKMLENNTDIGFCTCECVFFDKNNSNIEHSKMSQLTHTIEDHILNWGFMAPAFMLRRSVLEIIGKWNTTIFRTQDVDFFSRLFANDIKGIWNDTILYKVRLHDNRISNNYDNKSILSIISVSINVFEYFNSRGKMTNQLKQILSKRIIEFVRFKPDNEIRSFVNVNACSIIEIIGQIEFLYLKCSINKYLIKNRLRRFYKSYKSKL